MTWSGWGWNGSRVGGVEMSGPMAWLRDLPQPSTRRVAGGGQIAQGPWAKRNSAFQKFRHTADISFSACPRFPDHDPDLPKASR